MRSDYDAMLDRAMEDHFFGPRKTAKPAFQPGARVQSADPDSGAHAGVVLAASDARIHRHGVAEFGAGTWVLYDEWQHPRYVPTKALTRSV